jgi:hypothetical protein
MYNPPLLDSLDEYGIARENERPRDPELLTQIEARRLARAINAAGRNPQGTTAIAHTVPPTAWGGHEQGWSVSTVAVPA